MKELETRQIEAVEKTKQLALELEILKYKHGRLDASEEV